MSEQGTTSTIVPPHDHRGLTTAEALSRLKQCGPNAVEEEKAHPVKAFLRRFWAPIPWLLEATIIIQLLLGEKVEAAVIGGLLALNATLSLMQEGRAQKALALLRQQLRVLARPGLGGVVPAIEASRLVFQRIITYTLNMLIKKIEIMALLVIGFLFTGHKPLTPLLMVLFLFLNDFLTMSLAKTRVDLGQRILVRACPEASPADTAGHRERRVLESGVCISARISRSFPGRPGRLLHDMRVQHDANLFHGRRTTVSGFTTIAQSNTVSFRIGASRRMVP